MKKYQVDQELTFKPLNQRVKVVHVTPYHEDGDQNAFVTVELRSKDLRSVPVKIQDRYLTEEKPLLPWKKWPLPKQ